MKSIRSKRRTSITETETTTLSNFIRRNIVKSSILMIRTRAYKLTLSRKIITIAKHKIPPREDRDIDEFQVR